MRAKTAVLFWILLCLCTGVPAQPDTLGGLITKHIDESKPALLSGNTHPLARPEFDIGAAPSNLSMERMLMVLKRTAQQEAALKKRMDEQLDRSSPNYHKWLTPDQFGERFGPSDEELRTITAWLASHGFKDLHVSPGRTLVELSGNAAQVQETFHTAIHKYLVDGKEHWANATDPLIPAALTPLIAGLATLHNFSVGIGAHVVRSVSRRNGLALQTNIPSPCAASGLQPTGACFGISPYDFATLYNVLPLWKKGIDGAGQTIAIVAQSNIDIQDARNFRKLFGLPPNDPVIIVNGRNPGIVNSPTLPLETEAVSDVEWAGAVAPGATINLVVSAATNSTSGFDLSAAYIVNHNLAPILSASYGVCDSRLGSSLAQFYNSLWQQAAAQGITVLMGAGDAGSACADDPRASPPSPARNGLVAEGSAATPYNVAIGGTDFNDYSNASAYWSSASDPVTLASARGYIPETTWNDSCTNAAFGSGSGFNAETNCNGAAQAGRVRTLGAGGGRSRYFGKPSWQAGRGVPDDRTRDIPDVSLFAGSVSTGHFYLICEADREAEQRGASCDSTAGPPTHFLGSYGVSYAVPAFAGIMALIDQNSGVRQGNASPVLYQLADQQSGLDCNASGAPSVACIFHDVTIGTIAMPCAKGSSDCIVLNAASRYGILSGYDAGPGYDLATGLGSVDVCKLVTANGWGTNNVAASVCRQPGLVFAVPQQGGMIASTSGSGSLTVGYAAIKPNDNNSTPAGIAIFGQRIGDTLVTEAAVPATPLLSAGRIYAEVNGRATAGIAIANPNKQPAAIVFHLTDSSGIDVVTDSTGIGANQQIAKFLTEAPFNSSTAFQGTLTFTSDVPVAVIALRGYLNERNEFLWTTLPATDLSAAPATNTVYLPHFADGSGWTTQVVLVNPTDSAISGNVQFFSQGSDTAAGAPTAVTVDGRASTTFSYSIPRQSSFKLVTSGAQPSGVVLSGSIRVTPTIGAAPASLVIFSFKNRSGITLSEAGAPGIQARAFRMYAEETMAAGTFPAIQSGFAIANLSEAAVTVNLDLTRLDGSPAASTPVRIPGNGQIAKMLHDVFPNLTFPVQGVLRISGGSTAAMSAMGLRLRYNERGDVLTATTPPTNEDDPPGNTKLFFPQLVDGGGWTTQFILFTGSAGQTSAGELRFTQQDGSAFSAVLR